MSQGSVEPEGQGFESQVDNSQGQEQDSGTGMNPAWNDLLQSVPSSLHSTITPHLQQWDKNYQEGIGKVHSQYEAYKPFVEQGIDPEQLNYGLQLLEAFNTQPERIYEALKQHFGEDAADEIVNDLEDEQGQQSEPIDISQHPQFQQMAEMVNTMANLLVQQNSQEQEAQADSELENEFAQAKQQVGDFDEKWVIVQMMANENLSVLEAAQQYKEFEKSILANANRPGPRVLGGGGQSPNVGVSPSQLPPKDRRSLVANMLAEAQAQNG